MLNTLNGHYVNTNFNLLLFNSNVPRVSCALVVINIIGHGVICIYDCMLVAFLFVVARWVLLLLLLLLLYMLVNARVRPPFTQQHDFGNGVCASVCAMVAALCARTKCEPGESLS